MREDQQRFLSLLGQLPARLTVEQAAWILNCQPHDIPVLVAARLLKPLGNPPANGMKYFACAVVLESTKDPAWLFAIKSRKASALSDVPRLSCLPVALSSM